MGCKTGATQKYIILFGLVAMALPFQNCGRVNFHTLASSPSVNSSSTPTPNPTPTPTPTPPPTVPPSCTPSPNDLPVTTTLPTGVTAAQIQAICPAIGHDTECGVVIIATDSGKFLYFTGQGPFDGLDDTLVGVLNLSSQPVAQFNLSAQTKDIFGFDGDGIDGATDHNTSMQIMGNNMDTTKYGGPNVYFTNIANQNTTGTVNFITPVPAAGGTDFFALENKITSTDSCLTSN